MLHIEERLLRHDGAQNGNATPDGTTETPKRNFAIFNRPLPHHNSVVLGISGKPSQLVNTSLAEQDNIPLIKRFTGGGTVYITSDIRFVGFIINKSDISHVDPYPTPVMRWTGEIYEDCITSLREKSKTRFEKFGKTQQNEENLTFSLYENDYCLGNTRDEDTPDEGSGDEIKTAKALKFAGNAQSFIRDRILHHTSILWDLDIDNISKYLTLPSKRPAYRLNRSHRDFLTDLRPLFDPKNKEQNIDYFDDFCVGDNDIDNKAVIGGCEYTHHFTLGKNKLLELQDELQVITSAYYEELNRLRRENNVENGEKSQIDEKIAEKTAEYKKRRGEYQIRMDAIPFPNLYQYLENNLNQYHKHKSMLIGMGGVNNPEECQFNDAMLDALNQHFDVKVLSIEDVKDVLDCSDGQLGTYIIPPS
jgi:lipoate-protein ligase A